MNGLTYRPRLLEERLSDSLAAFPAVVVTGSRQTGKSTLVERGIRGPKRAYHTPALKLQDPASRRLWFAGYTQTYLERDLREIVSVASLPDFRRLMRASCLRLGSLMNQTEVARDIGMKQPTVHRHLGALEISHQILRLPAFSVNRTKRLVKSPKLYWNDPGLALFLAGETRPRGAHLENLILADLLAWQATRVDEVQVGYWRTTLGDEVDLVVESPSRVLPVEVKDTARLRLADAHGLDAFLSEYEDLAPAGLLLYTGSRIAWLKARVLAVPWWKVL